MKKAGKMLSLVLAAMMLISLMSIALTPKASAAGSPTFKFYFVFDKTSYSVGDTVTAKLYLQRTDDSADYALYNFTDRVTFNTSCLSYVSGTEEAANFRVESGTGGIYYNDAYKYISVRYQYLSNTGTPPLRSATLLAATLKFKVLTDCDTQLGHAETEAWVSLAGGGESVSTVPGSIVAGTPKYHSVTFSGGSGATGSVTSMSKVSTGTYITLPANGYAKSGKTFSGWYDGTKICEADSSYYIASDVSFTAAWSPAIITYSGPNGDVLCVNAGNVRVLTGSAADTGTRLTFTATANKDYKFTGWSDGSAENPHTITVIDDVNLTAQFTSTKSASGPVSVIVDGKDYNIGTSKVDNGTTTVVVDQTALEKQLDTASSSVVVPVSSDTSSSAAQLVVENVETMAEKNMTLTVQSGNVDYNIPTKAVDTSALMTKLGASDPAQVPVTVNITQMDSSAVTIKEGKLMLPPVSFSVTAAYGGKTVEVETFKNYVSRVITIPSGVDASKITTAVVLENGKERHVPTYVYLSGGVWYAKINSLTNSSYALIYNTASFTDSKNTWYDAAVTEMASRMIISGVGGGRFEGGRSITRAEFTAIIVRALGLPQNGSAAAFKDVPSSAWYAGTVGKAYEYGIVTGRSATSFDPQANITRQEAMAIIQRAAKIAGMTGPGSASLSAFTDAGNVSSWARSAVEFNVANGLIVGSNGKLNPTSNITRAETAAVILRMLQHSGLIDVRTNN